MIEISFDTWDKYTAAWRCLKTMCEYEWDCSPKSMTVRVDSKDFELDYSIYERIMEIQEGKWLYSY